MELPVVLITGTSKGIGKYLVEHYLKRSFFVVGCSRSEIDFKHPNYKHFKVDVEIESEIADIFKFLRLEKKRLDILINNAAINPAIISAALLPTEIIKRTFNTNVVAPMIFCKEAVKLMTRKKYGRIINMGSMAAKHEVPGEALYTATKAALSAYTRVLAKEVGKAGVTVNVVAPSVIKTDLSEKINQVALQEVLSRNAIHVYGDFEDVSNTIDFLIKPESSSITGQIIYLGGV